MKNEYDVIIIGAGPSGSSIGYLLKRAGISTLIIDKACFPRNKLCGGLITPKTKELYEKIYCESFKIYEARTNQLCLYYNKKLTCEVRTNQEFYFVDRSKFDNHLLNNYKSIDGEVLEGSYVKKFDFINNILNVNGNTIKYKYLIGADGANSTVRKYINSSYHPNALCLETNSHGVQVSPNKIHILFGDELCGYGWIFPKKKCVTIGVGGNIEYKNNIQKEKLQSLIQFASGSDFGEIRGAFIPYGKYVKTPFKNNVILIGDAAGLVDPITGEGIYFCFKSAFNISSEIIKKISSESSFDKDTLKKYKDIHKKINISRKFQKCLSKDIILKLVFLWIGKSEKFINYVCDNYISYYKIPLNMLLISYIKSICKRKQ